MATHSHILAWETPWTEELGGLQSMGLQRIGHDLAAKKQLWIVNPWRHILGLWFLSLVDYSPWGHKPFKNKIQLVLHHNCCFATWSLSWGWGCWSLSSILTISFLLASQSCLRFSLQVTPNGPQPPPPVVSTQDLDNHVLQAPGGQTVIPFFQSLREQRYGRTWVSHPMPAMYSGSNWTGKMHVVASMPHLESLFSLQTISPQLLRPPHPSQGPPWCQPTSPAPQVGDFFLQIFLLLCALSHSVMSDSLRPHGL